MDTKVIFHNNPRFRKKIAGFDLDHTLIKPFGNRTFNKGEDDWTWLNDKVLLKLEEYYKKGYLIVIITNQKRDYKLKLIDNVLQEIDIPLVTIIGRKELRKPDKDLFFKMFENKWKNKKVDYENSFYVGDAYDKSIHFSDSDRIFAENLNIKFYPVENMFV